VFQPHAPSAGRHGRALDAGVLDEPPYFINFVLGADRGFSGSICRIRPRILQQMVEMMPKGGDIQRQRELGPSNSMPDFSRCFSGGHVRVGLEGQSLLFAGQALRPNVEQVVRIVRIMRDLGPGGPATPAEAREIIGPPAKAVRSPSSNRISRASRSPGLSINQRGKMKFFYRHRCRWYVLQTFGVGGSGRGGRSRLQVADNFGRPWRL